MYDRMARYYDLIYSFKDYEEETRQIKVLINDLHPEAKTILDAGCGTGSHAMYLSSDFAVDGIDITSEFVEIAREKNRSGRFEVADMRNFDLGKTYDVVQCLFSSIGHLLFGEEVIRALTSFKKHLNPNGVILIEPWITPENWRDNDRVFMTVGESDDVKIVRMNTSERLGRLTRLNMAYLVGKMAKLVM